MPLAAATATGDPTVGRVILAGVILAVLGWYTFACWFWPFAACKVCQGSGKWHQLGQSKKKKRRNYRRCWWCKGTGKRLRLGRRVHYLVRATRDDAKAEYAT